MALKPEYEGDATQIPGAVLAVSRQDSGEFVGLYALTSEGTFIRGHASWLTATGKALLQIHDTLLVRMDRGFVETYDKLDYEGKIPTDGQIEAESIKTEPEVVAATNGPPFGWKLVAFKLFDAVALLHAAGHQRLHVLPTKGDLGWHFRVVLAEGITYATDSHPSANQESTVFAWSSAYGQRVGNLIVGPDTPASSIASLILADAKDPGIGTDTPYAGWYSDLVAISGMFGELPACDPDLPRNPVWELGYGTGILFPPPPAAGKKRPT